MSQRPGADPHAGRPPGARRPVGQGLPRFPWDTVAAARRRAAAHPDGIVDLSVGTPVDPVPAAVQAALRGPAAADPSYPTTAGTPELRAAAVAALSRRFGVPSLSPDAVLPTIGSKELVAWLPTLLGLQAGDLVAIPELGYPTYEVGARLVGASVVRLADGQSPPAGTRLRWLNSPANPTGRVTSFDAMREAVAGAWSVGAVLASDECYLALADRALADRAVVDPAQRACSVLDPAVCGGRHDGLLAVHSLSKSSNLAGYRAGFVTGDPAIVAELLAVRRHLGMIVPRPVQAAMVAALDDDAHLDAQAARYAARRARLREALLAAGLRVEPAEAGLYLWATAGEPGRVTVDALAERGVLVAPGEFYGPTGARHVRIALTATDERIDSAVHRLAAARLTGRPGPLTTRPPGR